MLGEKIRLLRKEKGMSQTELAEKMGTLTHLISRYESGKIMPSTETIIKFAKAFNVSTDFLLMETESRKPQKFDDSDLTKRFEDIKTLTEDDKLSLFHMLDALLVKNKMKSFMQNV